MIDRHTDHYWSSCPICDLNAASETGLYRVRIVHDEGIIMHLNMHLKTKPNMTRVQPRSRVLYAIFSLILLGSSVASAQTLAHPDSVSPLKENPYLKHKEPWRWDIRTQIFVRAGIVEFNNGRYEEELTGRFHITGFEYTFPVVRQGGHYWSPNEEIEVSMRIGDADYKPKFQVLYTPESRAPYIWWESSIDVNDNDLYQLHMTQVSHIVSADTIFNEELAKTIPWPKDWPLEAESFLTPVVDQINEDIDMNGQDRLTMLVDRWLEGNNPKSINQVTLVKYLTGKVIEHVRVTRSPEIYAPTVHRQSYQKVLERGFSSFPSSSWTGFLARSADQIALDPAGSPLDLSSMLVGVLRAAAIPARVVVCYDNSVILQANERIHAIVEFALYDPDSDQILWIPVDPERLRDNGRRSNTYTQPWEFFGTNDQLHNYVPLAYYFHPPVNYMAYGYPALYGIKMEPQMKQGVSQVISIDVMNSPLRADELTPAPNP
tara:strand:+ start:154569 stop:156035 length:1467 start_codon:yes stop_codon:yes gene_type:complete